MRLSGYGIVTTHGNGAKALYAALRGGVSRPTELAQGSWPVAPSGRSLAFYAPGRSETALDTLVSRLSRAWDEAAVPAAVRDDCALVFASTKGCTEDYIWTDRRAAGRADPFTPVVESFLARTGLRPREWVTVSNACASSHSAVHLARSWLERGVAKHVVVLAADVVGPFVLQGFHALHALSPTTCRPFHRDRDGLLLGEAAAVAVFDGQLGGEGGWAVRGTGLDCEGHAVTRPEGSGASLARAVRAAAGDLPIDAILAHGTATQANDQAEDQVFRALPGAPLVSATKWSVGHCLGASGLVDLVAAAEWLRAQAPFAISTCDVPDPAFSSRLLTPAALADLAPARPWKRLLVTALGFGGVHSAFTLEAP